MDKYNIIDTFVLIAMLDFLGTNAIPVLWQFFERWGSAQLTRDADWKPIAELLQPLGLHEKRAKMLIRFSGRLTNLWICC